MIGGYVNGLGLVRALAARGVPTAVVTTKPFDIAHRSRLVQRARRAPDIEERPEPLVEVLERRAGDWGGWALIPTNDEALAALAPHHDRLVLAVPRGGAAAGGGAAFARQGADARRGRARWGWTCRTATARRRREQPGARTLRFPVIVKPRVPVPVLVAVRRASCSSRADRAELGAASRGSREAGIPGQVFDLVPGPDSRDLRLLHLHRRARRAGRGRDGPQAAPEPAALRRRARGRARRPMAGAARGDGRAAAADRLSRHRGRRVQASTPRDGRFRFIEVNGRSVVYNGLLREAGLDLARARLGRLRARAPRRVPRRTAGAAPGSTCTPTCSTRRCTRDAPARPRASSSRPTARPTRRGGVVGGATRRRSSRSGRRTARDGVSAAAAPADCASGAAVAPDPVVVRGDGAELAVAHGAVSSRRRRVDPRASGRAARSSSGSAALQRAPRSASSSSVVSVSSKRCEARAG